jgi:hypothetical protein
MHLTLLDVHPAMHFVLFAMVDFSGALKLHTHTVGIHLLSNNTIWQYILTVAYIYRPIPTNPYAIFKDRPTIMITSNIAKKIRRITRKHIIEGSSINYS